MIELNALNSDLQDIIYTYYYQLIYNDTMNELKASIKFIDHSAHHESYYILIKI
jgi:hypothetical protein